MLKSCIQWASVLLGWLWLHSVSAQTVHISHCLAGCPSGTPAANEIVVRHLFAASINYQSGLADWVAYRILPDSVGVASLLPREWEPDQLLAQELAIELNAEPGVEQPDLSNTQDGVYRVTEVVVNLEDRGRLVPMSSFAGTPYWQDLNYLSNMAPIPADLRVGPWARLDQAINEMADRIGEVFVISGPLYRVNSDTPLNQSANRPFAFFKFVANTTGQAAFLFAADTAQHSHHCDAIASAAEVQALSGLDFLPQAERPGNEDLFSMLGCDSARAGD